MEAITTTATSDPTRVVVDAVRRSLAQLDEYALSDMTDDIEMAEVIGKLKSLAGVLVSVVDRGGV
ncbi:MAG: hypothetical protein ACRDN9_05705 [Streptosporangiaceae bacterium]